VSILEALTMSEWETMWARIWAKLLGRPANFSIRPKAGAVKVEGQPVTWVIKLAPEHWQVFAFVFGALLTLAYAVMDALPCLWPQRCGPWVNVGAKVLVFFALAWITLWCWWFKVQLIRLLNTITTRTQRSS
jgi:hypothetical protein